MNANDISRDPRLSRTDPRVVRHNQMLEENKKRAASQAPAGATEPNQKNPKAAIVSNGPSINDPRRRPSVDHATPSSSRRASVQSNGVNSTNASSNSNITSGTNTTQNLASHPAAAANAALNGQTAPVANMSNGGPAHSPNPNVPSVISNLPAQPDMFDLLQATGDINGKLSYARVEKDKAGRPLEKAITQYKTMSQYFKDFPAIKEMHTNSVRIAQKKFDNASELVTFFEHESAQMRQITASVLATGPSPGALFGRSTADSVPAHSKSDPDITKQLDEIQQKLQGVQQQVTEKLDGVQQQVTALQQNYNSLKDDMSSLRNSLSLLEEGASSQKADMSKCQTNVKTLTADMKDLKLDIKENETTTKEEMEKALEKLASDFGNGQTALDAQLKTLEEQSRQLEESFESVKKEVAAVGKGVTEQGNGADINRKHENLRKALDELVVKMSKVETEAKNKSVNTNPLGLVQFTPVVGPEDEQNEQELPQMQRMWSAIESLRMATDNNKKQLDNLTTDDVVHQMVNVMGQHWPDAKNCQAAVDSLKAGIANINQRIDQVASGQAQGHNGQAQIELDELRSELDQLKIKVDGQDLFLSQGKQQFDEVISRVSGIANQVAGLEGQQEAAMQKAFG